MNVVDERIFKIPPKKVVKANQNYTAQYSQEISFKEGDFFYVIDEDELYYSIINPAEKISGLVPKIFCDALDKSVRRNTQPIKSTYNSGNRGQYRSEYNTLQHNHTKFDDDDEVYTTDASDVPPEQLFTAKVVECGYVEGKRFQITIKLTKPAKNKKYIIRRLYDDLYAMQMILLKLFSKEAGRVESYERLLPFLPPAPTQVLMNYTKENVNLYKKELDAYIKEMARMPKRIQSSFPVKRFFLLRSNDIEKPMLSEDGSDSGSSLERSNVGRNSVCDNGDDFLDLIADYDEEFLLLKIVFRGKVMKMDISDKITFRDLWIKIEDFLDMDIVDVYFKDEENYEIPLLNDIDLGNFLRTRRYRLLLFVE